MQAVSISIISLTINNPSLDINGNNVWSKGLFVKTRTARFCSFCNFLKIIDVGSGGHWGPQDFAVNKEVPSLFL